MRGGRRQGGGRQGGRGRDARKEVGRCAVYSAVYSAVYRVQCTTCRVRRVLYRADLTYYLAGRGGREGGRKGGREGGGIHSTMVGTSR